MTLIEFIGFIITMIAFFLLIAKQARDERRRREHPEEFEQELEEQQVQIRQILESLDLQVAKDAVEEEKKKPKPPPAPEKRYDSADDDTLYIEEKRRQADERGAVSPTVKPKLGESLFIDVHAKKRKTQKKVHEDAYEMLKFQKSKVHQALGDVDSLKNAVILKEVLGPPISLQQNNERF